MVDASGRPIGVLTEGDLLRRVETGTEGKAPGWLSVLFAPGRLAEHYIRSHARRVSEVMTPEAQCVQEDTPLEEVVALMQRKGIKRLPVVSGSGWSASSPAPTWCASSPMPWPPRPRPRMTPISAPA